MVYITNVCLKNNMTSKILFLFSLPLFSRKYLEHMPYNVGAWRALAQLGKRRERGGRGRREGEGGGGEEGEQRRG
jgi:RimJ/RimL family protein N-acetyltransferase